MRFVSLRRAVPMSMAAAAALAMGLPGVASAKSKVKWKTDVLTQCEGSNIQGEGSTFQAPAEFLWTGFNAKGEAQATGFNNSTSSLACSGSKKPTVEFINREKAIDEGSGSCLKTWGNGISSFGEEKTTGTETAKYPRVSSFPFCGTDEAPSEAVKEEFENESLGFVGAGLPNREGTFEEGKSKQKGAAIESLPVAQGAVAIVVHLPEACTTETKENIKTSKGKETKPHRLALDQKIIRGIYEGTYRTWAAAITAQNEETGAAKNELKCEPATAAEDEISVVVRRDKSGTTHIFKSFLAQVEPKTEPTFEAFETINGTEHPCEKSKATEEKYKVPFTESWEAVQEGCQNQRWPEAAKVVRPAKTGNPGVLETVNSTPSSIGYADLAVAAEKKWFTQKETVEGSGKSAVHTHNGGGETSKKEFNHRFWAVVQNSTPGSPGVTYEDPATKGDTEKEGESNCKESKYVAAKGAPFPPESTREDWSKVKAENVSETYADCGVTYVLAAKQYFWFLEPYFAGDTTPEIETKSKEVATAVHDYLSFIVSTKAGGKELKNHDYAALTKEVAERAEKGAEEIGSKISEEE